MAFPMDSESPARLVPKSVRTATSSVSFIISSALFRVSPERQHRACSSPHSTITGEDSLARERSKAGWWVAVIGILAGSSSFHTGVIRNVKPTEDAVDDDPKDRVVNAPGQCYGEHAAESPDADTSRAPVATVAHWGSPCARNRAEPV